MRKLLGVIVIVAGVACAEDAVRPPNVHELQVAGAPSLTSAHMPGTARGVWLELNLRGAELRQGLVVTDEQDGVTISLAHEPGQGFPLDWMRNRPVPFSASASVSQGTRLFDRSGAPIPPMDVADMRKRIGLPSNPDHPLTPPGARDAQGGPIGRTDKGEARLSPVVTAERAARELEALRMNASGEVRVAPHRLEFRRVQGDRVEVLVFDERVGAVVTRAIWRGGSLYLTIEDEFEAVEGGYQMVRSTAQWYDETGAAARTVVQRISAP